LTAEAEAADWPAQGRTTRPETARPSETADGRREKALTWEPIIPDRQEERDLFSGGAQPVQIVLTVEQAARLLGIGRTLMFALVKRGEVESVTIGRLRRIPIDALDRYVSSLRAAAPPNDGRVA